MKTILFLLFGSIVAIMSCQRNSHLDADTTPIDSSWIASLHSRSLDATMISNLKQWREDSLGCLGFRDRFMKDNNWMKKLQLSESSKTQVLDMLGEPNELMEYPPNSAGEYGEIRFNYYTKSGCIPMNKRIEPRGIEEQLHVIFDYEAGKVKKVLGSLN